MIKNQLVYNSFFYNQEQQEVEKKFIAQAEPFLHWFINAPYEDEEGEYKGLNYKKEEDEPKKEEKTVNEEAKKVTNQEIDDL